MSFLSGYTQKPTLTCYIAGPLLYSYEAGFIQTFTKRGERDLEEPFYFAFRYIDAVLSLSNPKLSDLYSFELEIKVRDY